MTVNNPGVERENTDRDASGAAQTGEVVANSYLDDRAVSQEDDRSAIATLTSSSPVIPKTDGGAMLEEERQLHQSTQGDSITKPSSKRSRSPSRPDRADGCISDWVFDVLAEDDGETKGDGSPSSKRARSSSCLSKSVQNQLAPATAVKGVPIPDTAQANQSLRGDQEYKVQQVVGESGSEYEVTALTKMWLPKASVDPRLVRKYRAEQRAATQVRTRWSSRLHNK